jgi:hypothetical protein
MAGNVAVEGHQGALWSSPLSSLLRASSSTGASTRMSQSATSGSLSQTRRGSSPSTSTPPRSGPEPSFAISRPMSAAA